MSNHRIVVTPNSRNLPLEPPLAYSRVVPSRPSFANYPYTPQQSYYRKYKRLKRLIKDTVFENAAICDEVTKVEEQYNAVYEATRHILRKVIQCERLSEASKDSKPDTSMVAETSTTTAEPTTSKAKVKRKAPLTDKAERPESTNADPVLSVKPKKRTKGGALKKTVPLLPLDEFGRPMLPLELGELTVHSLGEICNDKRTNFHCPESIYPVGFCSTRVYGSSDNALAGCLYTCKISDDDSKPVFEISPEDNPVDIHGGDQPLDCLKSLIQSLSLNRTELSPTHADSLAFFGLTHPVVQNLIQSCPGSKKCPGYKWVKFEINRDLAPDCVETDENTPTVSYEALIDAIRGRPTHPTNANPSKKNMNNPTLTVPTFTATG